MNDSGIKLPPLSKLEAGKLHNHFTIPDGFATVRQAALALGTTPEKIRSLVSRQQVAYRQIPDRRNGLIVVRVKDLVYILGGESRAAS